MGTNVQVAGVDELDYVKAVGKLIYDLDGKGNLRITDAEALQVLSTLDVTPGPKSDDGDGSGPARRTGERAPGGRRAGGDLRHRGRGLGAGRGRSLGHPGRRPRS